MVIEFLVRILISIPIFLVPFVLFLLRSRQMHKELILLYPLFGLIPGLVSAAVIFVPIEYLLRLNGLVPLITPAVIAAGAAIVLIFAVLIAGRKVKAASRPGLISWIIAGAWWGVAWRLSEGAVAWAGLSNG